MSRKDLFTGRGGQLAVMSEFLIRAVNVAIPEVDVGDDIVVVRDDNDFVTRVQVKAAAAKFPPHKPGCFSALFRIPLRQLELVPSDLVYVFVVRGQRRWEEFVIVRRSVLNELRVDHGIGQVMGESLMLKLAFSPDGVTNNQINFQPFRGAFEPFPPTYEIPAGVVPAGNPAAV